MSALEACSNKAPQEYNNCVIGFQHGKRKRIMEEDLASGPLGKAYGDGYKVGRELAFKQTGSTRKKSKKSRKSRRTKKLNGRK